MQDWYAVAPPGLEPVVAREIAALGLEVEVQPGGVQFQAPLNRARELVRRLRTPSRLQLVVGKGHARSLEELATLVRRANWTRVLDPRIGVTVSVRARASRLHRTEPAEKKVAHALADVQRGLPRPRGPWPKGTQPIGVHLDQDRATLSVDAGGEHLHMRGWRTASGKAPLRETLAAAILVAAGYDGEEPLLDPFCGAGTLPIEAALLASGRSPHQGRIFAADAWPGADPAPQLRDRLPPAPIVGSDHDASVVEQAKANAARARVKIEWAHLDVREIEPPGPGGLLVANPPYGMRLGASVEGVYRTLGHSLRERFSGWRAVFLAPDPELAALVHRGAQRLTVFPNGGIRVGLYVLEL